MSKLDVIIRGGTLVTREGLRAADVGIADEKIVALGEELSGAAGETVDARGLHIFPELIDSHVHFNDPGRAEWEGKQWLEHLESNRDGLAPRSGGGVLRIGNPRPTTTIAGFMNPGDVLPLEWR